MTSEKMFCLFKAYDTDKSEFGGLLAPSVPFFFKYYHLNGRHFYCQFFYILQELQRRKTYSYQAQ